MMDPLVPVGDGHTELPEEDRLGLIPTYISNRGELFDAEQRNIAKAMLRRAPALAQLLDDMYLRDLHRAMFEDVWEWAGHYRNSERNIGIAPEQIAPAIRNLVDDVRTWIEVTAYEPDQIAVRFHHRLEQIHPFPNGNGRHGRIAADYLIQALGHEPFSWGAGLAVETDDLGTIYRRALRRADGGEIVDLLAFARN